MNRHPDDDQLLDLVLELLPREREEEILEHVGQCPACEQRMRHQAGERERLASEPGRAEFRQALAVASMRSPLERPSGAERPTVGERLRRWLGEPRPIRRLLPIGGGLVGLALLVFLVIPRDRSPELELEANWLPAGSILVQRGSPPGSAMSGMLAEGLAAYNRRDLPSAIQNLETATVLYDQEPFRCLYLANALVQSGAYAQAVKVLRPFATDVLPEPWATEGHWTLLVALEGAGMRASADSLRRVLATHPGEIGKRVRSLR